MSTRDQFKQRTNQPVARGDQQRPPVQQTTNTTRRQPDSKVKPSVNVVAKENIASTKGFQKQPDKKAELLKVNNNNKQQAPTTEQRAAFQNQKNQKLYEKLDQEFGRDTNKPITKITNKNLYQAGHPPPPPPPPEPVAPKQKKGQQTTRTAPGLPVNRVKLNAATGSKKFLVKQPAAKPGVQTSQRAGKPELRPGVGPDPSFIPSGTLTARDIAGQGPIPKVQPLQAYQQVSAVPPGLSQQSYLAPAPHAAYPSRHIVADIPIYMTAEGYSTVPYIPDSTEGRVPINQDLYLDRPTAGYPSIPPARRPAIDPVRYSDHGNYLYQPLTDRNLGPETRAPLTYRPTSSGEKRPLASEPVDAYGAVKRPFHPSNGTGLHSADQLEGYSQARRNDSYKSLEHLKYSPDRMEQAEKEREYRETERHNLRRDYRPSWVGSPKIDPIHPRKPFAPKPLLHTDSFEDGYSARNLDRESMHRDIQQWQKEDSWIKEQLNKSQDFLTMNKSRPHSRHSDGSKQSKGRDRYNEDEYEVNRGDSTYRKPHLPYNSHSHDTSGGGPYTRQRQYDQRMQDGYSGQGYADTFRDQKHNMSDRDREGDFVSLARQKEDNYRRSVEERYADKDGYSKRRQEDKEELYNDAAAAQRQETQSLSGNDKKMQYVLRTKSNSRVSNSDNADNSAKQSRLNSYRSDPTPRLPIEKADSRYEDVDEKLRLEQEGHPPPAQKDKQSVDTSVNPKRELSSTMLTARQSPIGSERIKAQPSVESVGEPVPLAENKPAETESFPKPFLPLAFEKEPEELNTYRSQAPLKPSGDNEPPLTSRVPQTYRQPPVDFNSAVAESPRRETETTNKPALKTDDISTPPKAPEPSYPVTPRSRPQRERTVESQGPTRDEVSEPKPKSAREESKEKNDNKDKDEDNKEKSRKERTGDNNIQAPSGAVDKDRDATGPKTEGKDDTDKPGDDWDDLNFDLIEDEYPGNDMYMCYLVTDDGAAIGPMKLDIEDVKVGLPNPSKMEEVQKSEDQKPTDEEGMRNRQTGSHGLNEFSSRSHSMLMLTIDSEQQDPEDENLYITKRGKLTFVDLAGSEKVKDSNSTAETLIESNNINRSLLVLGNCISSLGDAKRRQGHIPYRDSKLTKLLADSLGGNGVTLMICCITPSSHHAPETVNTLRYASRAKKIRSKPVIKMDPREKLIMSLKREIKVLRNENHYLRQQLEFPAKPRGQLQKENDEKFMKLVKEQNGKSVGPTAPPANAAPERAKQNGATEESGLYEMLQEYMVENESLRTENSEMQVNRDKMKRDQQLLYRDNEKLLKRVDDLERRLNQSVNAWQNMPRQGSYPEQIHHSRDHSPRGSPQYVRQGQGSGGRMPAGRLPPPPQDLALRDPVYNGSPPQGYASPTGSGQKSKQAVGRQHPLKPPHRLVDHVPRQGPLEGQGGAYMNGVQSPPYKGNPGSPSKQDPAMKMDSRRSSQSSSSDAIRDMNEKLKAELAQLEGQIHQHQMLNGSTRSAYGSQGSIR